MRPTCPGCGGGLRRSSLRFARQPVVLNYRFATAAGARRVKRRDLVLRQCAGCGLVFNAAFDPEAIPYDANYENRQCFSPAFQGHLVGLARRLTVRHGLRGGRILEVGCGKGDFLRLLCRQARASGGGYDTTYEGPAEDRRARLTFHPQYLTADRIRSRFDAVICRHVVEHVPEIGSFLRELRAIASACGDPVVVLETPSWEWIATHLCLWDIFYEHCNYFPKPTLARLCEQAGFRVVGHRTVFGRQYQLLELRLARRNRVSGQHPPPLAASVVLDQFARAARGRVQALERAILRVHGKGCWALWGAGAKGVALVHLLRRTQPCFVIDSNRAKQGCFIPGSTLAVVSPDDPRILDQRLVLVANPNYRAEITSVLRARGFARTILCL